MGIQYLRQRFQKLMLFIWSKELDSIGKMHIENGGVGEEVFSLARPAFIVSSSMNQLKWDFLQGFLPRPFL